MLCVVVQHSEILNFAHALQVEHDVRKTLRRLLQRCADNQYPRPGRTLKQRKPQCKSGDKRRFSVFSRNKDERLFESAFIGACFEESEQIVDYEFLPRFQDKRLTKQWCAVKALSFFVGDTRLDESYDELCILDSEIPSRVIQII